MNRNETKRKKKYDENVGETQNKYNIYIEIGIFVLKIAELRAKNELRNKNKRLRRNIITTTREGTSTQM